MEQGPYVEFFKFKQVVSVKSERAEIVLKCRRFIYLSTVSNYQEYTTLLIKIGRIIFLNCDSSFSSLRNFPYGFPQCQKCRRLLCFLQMPLKIVLLSYSKDSNTFWNWNFPIALFLLTIPCFYISSSNLIVPTILGVTMFQFHRFVNKISSELQYQNL